MTINIEERDINIRRGLPSLPSQGKEPAENGASSRLIQRMRMQNWDSERSDTKVA